MLERALQAEPPPATSGPTPSAPQARAPAGSARASSSRVASGVSLAEAHRDRVRRRAPACASNSSCRQRPRGYGAPRCRSTRRASRPLLGPRPAAAARRAARSGSRGDRRRAARAKCAGQPLDRRRVEEVGARTRSSPGRPVGRSRPATSVRSNFAVADRGRQRLERPGPAAPSLGARRVLQREHHLEQRRAAQVPLRLQLLDQPLERHVLVGVGAERRLPHPAEQLARTSGRRRGRRAAPAC